MEIKELLLKEWSRESESTRKMLERIPEDKLSWKPHEKSKSLGALAQHVAAVPGRWAHVLDGDVFDPTTIKQPQLTDKAGILNLFEEGNARLSNGLKNATDEELGKDFTFSPAGKPQFTMAKGLGISIMLFGHMIHHRAQLSVYLRLLNIPVPGMYGPSADE